MKKIIFLILLSLFAFNNTIEAQTKKSTDVYVKPYTRKDGVKVKGHYRTSPNYTNRDNFSTKGNINPYTGKKGTVNPDNNRLNYSGSNNYSTNDGEYYYNYGSYREVGVAGVSVGVLNFVNNEFTTYSPFKSVKADLFVYNYLLGLGYSYGETSYSHKKASISDFTPGQAIDTETFWLYAGFRTFRNLYLKLGLGFRSETFDEELYNNAYYGETVYSAGLTYPINMGGFLIAPEINFSNNQVNNSIELNNYGINVIFRY
jgi:hypothetical protein